MTARDFLNKQFSSFTYLNITQFLGALNDNIYKLLIVYFLLDIVGMENSYTILSTTGAIFVLPFLLFSASSGILADRFSKRNIIVLTKVFELLIMAFGVLSFAFESTTGAYTTLFLMATQSAIFGPSKYGIIPELVSDEKISRANGLMTSFTFLAIIIGTFLASFITDITGRNFILAALLCTVIALVGVTTSFGIEYTPPSGSSKRLDFFFIREVMRALKIAHSVPSLLPAIFGSMFFLFLGAFMQLNMIPFAVYSLGLSDVQGGYLFLLAALGIGTGSVLAGRISGKSVEMGLVPVSAFGLAIGSFFIDYFANNIILIIPLVVILGMLGGLFQVPLDSYIQIASPNKQRGQVIAAANFMSFIGVLMASGFIYITSGVLGVPADSSFTLMGILSVFVTVVFAFQFYDYTTRFIGMILSYLHFSTSLNGEDNIPKGPGIYVCQHTAWNDTLLMLGSQRRRMRFFVEKEQEHSVFMKRLYKCLRIIMIPEIESIQQDPKSLKRIKQALQKGISVCIFTAKSEIDSEVELLKNSRSFEDIYDGTSYPIIPVTIEKGEKDAESKYFSNLISKLRVPAKIQFNTPI